MHLLDFILPIRTIYSDGNNPDFVKNIILESFTGGNREALMNTLVPTTVNNWLKTSRQHTTYTYISSTYNISRDGFKTYITTKIENKWGKLQELFSEEKKSNKIDVTTSQFNQFLESLFLQFADIFDVSTYEKKDSNKSDDIYSIENIIERSNAGEVESQAQLRRIFTSMYNVVKASENDLVELIVLYNDNGISFIPMNLKDHLDMVTEKYKKIVTQKNYYLLVAKAKECFDETQLKVATFFGVKENEILGTVTGIICDSICEECRSFMVLENNVVKEGVRGFGIATAIHSVLDKIALDNYCSYAIVVSSTHRKAAHKFLKDNKFIDPVLGFRKSYLENHSHLNF